MGMRLRIAVVSVAVMLLPLAAVGGGPGRAPTFPEVAMPAPVLHGRAAEHAHPCTPYAGCESVAFAEGAGSQAP
jgi:hypothetical protein